MTLPVHLVTELKKYVDKPVKHWHHTTDELPQEGTLLLIETITSELIVVKYTVKDYGYWKGGVYLKICVVLTGNFVKW